MSRQSRRLRAQQQSDGSASVPGCGRVWLPRARVLLLGLCGVLVLAMVLGVYLSNYTEGNSVNRLQEPDWTRDRLTHKPTKCSTTQIRHLVSQLNGKRLWETYLRPILIERLPGTSGSLMVQQHITSTLASLSAGWDIILDSFQSSTPRGQVTFTNIVATLDPGASRRLILACHYDSKLLPTDSRDPNKVFLGASDSAVPCAMILELVTMLDAQLKTFKQQSLPVTLGLLFFDGEESFEEWTDTDSLYGSRHLAEHMAASAHPSGASHTSMLQAVDLFVLLDLLGGSDPLIVNHFENTARWFDRLITAEKRLHRLGLLASHPYEQAYFRKDVYFGPVEDDHIPFLRRGVPVLHIIPTPFPQFWHTMDDTEENMHRPTVENLTKIVAIFLTEYLGL